MGRRQGSLLCAQQHRPQRLAATESVAARAFFSCAPGKSFCGRQHKNEHSANYVVFTIIEAEKRRILTINV